MNNFKKNIFKKRTDDIVVPPTYLFGGGISQGEVSPSGVIGISSVCP